MLLLLLALFNTDEAEPPLPPPPPTDWAKIPAEFSPVVEINEAILGAVTPADAAVL